MQQPMTTIPGTPLRVHRSAITVPGVAGVLAVMLAMSLGFGQLDTSMAGTAGELLGGTDRVGLLFGAIAGGSTIGGLAFGSRVWPLPERKAVMVTTGLFSILLVGIATVVGTGHPPLWMLLPTLFCTGLTIAPTLIMQQSLLDHLAPVERLNEAQSMLSSVTQVGAAIGTAVAGLLIDSRGLAWSFSGAAIAVAASCLVAFGCQRMWARLTQTEPTRSDEPGTAAADTAC
jgi:predicted MFS family arabinose efflux permease